MKLKLVLICSIITGTMVAQPFQKIHSDATLIDTHNDILTKTVEYGYSMDADLRGKTHSDLARWKEGGLDVQIFSVFCDGNKIYPFLYANRQMDSLDAVIMRNPDKIEKATNPKELAKIVNQHKIAAMFGVEGGHMIENDLNKLDAFYNRGARYMTITWNNSTSWATSAYDETFNKELTYKGLNEFGILVIKRMNELGMIVDVSHVGEETFWDIINTTRKPVIASHSSVYALCQHQRNLKDAQIQAIAKNGGVIQVNFYSGFLINAYMNKKDSLLAAHKDEIDSLKAIGKTEDQYETFIFNEYKKEMEPLRAPFSAVMEHIEYIIKLVGVDYVGIGSDFDGIESSPLQLDDVTKYPVLTEALVAKGYSEKDIRKILGGNFLRVLSANERKY